ncbi:hypothetical protein ASE95_01100 [Sphingomonas sp. Leaf231]|uniref:hypothetical protein n=1 Tax=Sphingomonas sp. Leaf231 TaxID=1736301 RepID=UPI0006F5A485|nr:hypothetical protein [Sphingomonas sp. Leaf231]KQN93576.1 hypothetical protein ASE95_01100 [Sphingomonas sp. Leaf231]
MTVGRDYMLKKDRGPSAPKVFVDTQVVPRLVNAAGGAEVALDRAARWTGMRPSLLLAGAVAGLSLATAGALRARRGPSQPVSPAAPSGVGSRPSQA